MSEPKLSYTVFSVEEPNSSHPGHLLPNQRVSSGVAAAAPEARRSIDATFGMLIFLQETDYDLNAFGVQGEGLS